MKYCVIVLLLALLTSCSYRPPFIHNRSKEYLAARSIPPLRIPPEIDSEKMRNQYPISSREYPGSTQEISLVPPGLYS